MLVLLSVCLHTCQPASQPSSGTLVIISKYSLVLWHLVFFSELFFFFHLLHHLFQIQPHCKAARWRILHKGTLDRGEAFVNSYIFPHWGFFFFFLTLDRVSKGTRSQIEDGFSFLLFFSILTLSHTPGSTTQETFLNRQYSFFKNCSLQPLSNYSHHWWPAFLKLTNSFLPINLSC